MGFPRTADHFGVPRIRTIVCWGPPMLAEYHILSNRDASHDPFKDTQISLRVPLKGPLNPKPQTLHRVSEARY